MSLAMPEVKFVFFVFVGDGNQQEFGNSVCGLRITMVWGLGADESAKTNVTTEMAERPRRSIMTTTRPRHREGGSEGRTGRFAERLVAQLGTST